MKSYIPDYPRPQLVRSQWQNLNGAWDFCFDDAQAGEAKGWQRSFEPTHKIEVPFTYETAKSGIGDESVHPAVWYSRSFTLGEADAKRTTLLHFEGSDYITTVWINGEKAGSHTGGYARFSFDITAFVKAGENRLTVRVEDSLADDQVRGKQRWIKDNFGCWYVQTTGIWKTVWLESVPAAYISAIKLTPCLKTQTLTIEAQIGGDSAGATLAAAALFGGAFAADAQATVKNGSCTLRLELNNTDIDPWGVKAWAPEHPHLYDLELKLLKDGAEADSVLSYFGMRSIEIQGNMVLLNGRPLYQRLILDQGYWEDSHLTPPDEQALITDIDKIKELGYNGLRKHQKTEDERFLYWCDVKGMLVWCEMPSAYKFTDKMVKSFTDEWLEIVLQNYSHPAIITWTPVNESWGVPQIRTDRAQQHFTEAVYHITKAVDPMRPVIVNDGWEHTISDIITLHDYQEVGSLFLDKYDGRRGEVLANTLNHCDHRFAFAQGYEYRGQPVLISEYGGIAFSKGEGWGYGNKVETEEQFIARFKDITNAIQKLDYVCGFCYTQVTDVQQEINGLMDIKRNFKISPEAVREINLERNFY